MSDPTAQVCLVCGHLWPGTWGTVTACPRCGTSPGRPIAAPASWTTPSPTGSVEAPPTTGG